MVLFFFYKNLINTELIKKINSNFVISDGYILIQKYNNEKNILEISDNNKNNNDILHGKIVNFNMKIEDVIQKMNKIDECKFKNKNTRYILNNIWANKNSGGLCNVYIIY